MTEFLESLKETGYQKESIFDETYDYETTVNEKNDKSMVFGRGGI